MAAIDNFINITVTQQTQAVSIEGFGIPLIVGATDPGWETDVVRTYSAPSDLLSDGFTSDAPEYKCAQAMYAGTTSPVSFCVGRRTSGGMADDLNAIFAENDSAYGVVLADLPEQDILDAAAAIEGMTKLLIVSATDDAIAISGTADLASQLKDLNYNRTGLCFTKKNVPGILESAWMGSQLPQTPGSNNWAYKSLPGIAVDAISPNMQSVLYGVPVAGVSGKNVNVYQSVGGANITFPGMAASGRYFDLTIGVDWLTANIQGAIYSLLVNSPKIPYTTAGVTSIMNAVNQVLQTAIANDLLDGQDPVYPVYVKADSVDSVSVNQRAQRISPNIYFGGRLKGALNSIIVRGSVSV